MTEIAAQRPATERNNPILANSLMSKQELERFKEIALKEYGVRLTDEQAFEQATALLLLVDTLIEKSLANKRNRVNINTIQK